MPDRERPSVLEDEPGVVDPALPEGVRDLLHGANMNGATRTMELPATAQEAAPEHYQSPAQTIFCLWRHVRDQLPDAREKILEAIGDAKPKVINVYWESVGASPERRAQFEQSIDRAVDRSGFTWQVGKVLSRAGHAFLAGAGGDPRRREHALYNIERIDLLREIGKRTGAQVRFRTIDIDESTPRFHEANVSIDSLKTDELLSRLKLAAKLFARDAERLLKNLLTAHEQELAKAAEILVFRDDYVRKQLSEMTEADGPDTLNIVMAGAMHAAIARGSVKAGSEIVVSATPEFIRDDLPLRYRNNLTMALDMMKLRKIAYAGGLGDGDRKEMVIAKILRAKIMDALQAQPKRGLSQRGEMLDAADFLASAYVLQNAKKIDKLWGSCVESFKAEKLPSQTKLLDSLGAPLAELARQLASEPEAVLGFDPFDQSERN